MYQVGHYGAALLLYTPLGIAVALAGHETTAIVGILACVALSTLPDIDHRIPKLPHRGPTHSIPFVLIVGVGLAAITAMLVDAASAFADIGFIAFAFVVGTLSIVSHLLADLLTPMGIRPFWPLSRRQYTLEVTKAANPLANYILFGIGTGAVVIGAVVVAVLA